MKGSKSSRKVKWNLKVLTRLRQGRSKNHFKAHHSLIKTAARKTIILPTSVKTIICHLRARTPGSRESRLSLTKVITYALKLMTRKATCQSRKMKKKIRWLSHNLSKKRSNSILLQRHPMRKSLRDSGQWN